MLADVYALTRLFTELNEKHMSFQYRNDHE